MGVVPFVLAGSASSEYNPANRHGAVADFGRVAMGIRFSGMLLAVVTTAFVIAPGSAWAQFNVPGFGGSVDRMGGGGGGKGATGKATTVKSSKSNTSDRMGGGGGTKAGGTAANRMGGGGGAKSRIGHESAHVVQQRNARQKKPVGHDMSKSIIQNMR
jgi:hypothetical protein